MQCEMAWSRACLKFRRGLFARREFSSRRIEPVNHHFVDAEIRGERVTLRAIEDDAMRVWSFLLFLDARSFVLLHVDRHPKCAVRTHWQRSKASPGVICDEQSFSFAIDRQVTGVSALSGLFIQQPEISGCAVDRKCTDATTGFAEILAHFVHGIQVTFASIDCEERRVH